MSLYFGALLAMLAYNGFLFMSVRDRGYLHVLSGLDRADQLRQFDAIVGPIPGSQLEPFLIPGVFNVFTHQQVLKEGITLGGTAYDIPNTDAYVSLAGPGNVSSPNDIVTMAHEVGHALGLFHTFEPHSCDPLHDTESVERNQNASCWDCDVDGDYVCDTPPTLAPRHADYWRDSALFGATNSSGSIAE